ncbi:CLUMA_CG015210, isoform A [Clunio marinus]|uniref:CLUMA_CG015210, isoform A n=1 Tax=Clunio marinus TaxID=568069 RepID=A0A1J1IQ54_9DIPT|nr:CLUMA_CG015210, isoform A [Clunio marinus]
MIVQQSLLILWDVLKTIFVSIGLIFTEIKRLFFYKRKDVRGKLALVTGGANGLGRGICLRLAELGCRIAIADINLKAAEKTCEEIRGKGYKAKAYKIDVTNADEITKLRDDVFNDLGTVDILINNAGLMSNKNLEETSENIEAMLKVNILGVILNLRTEKWRKKIKTTCVCPYYIKTREDVIDFLNPKFPALEMEDAANETVEGILREDRVVTIPRHQMALCKFLNIFPLSVQEAVRDRILKEYEFNNPNCKLNFDF